MLGGCFIIWPEGLHQNVRLNEKFFIFSSSFFHFLRKISTRVQSCIITHKVVLLSKNPEQRNATTRPWALHGMHSPWVSTEWPEQLTPVNIVLDLLSESSYTTYYYFKITQWLSAIKSSRVLNMHTQPRQSIANAHPSQYFYIPTFRLSVTMGYSFTMDWSKLTLSAPLIKASVISKGG